MTAPRNIYPFSIVVNGLEISAVIIDPHYKERHSLTINDELILKMVRSLNNEFHNFIDEKQPFKYFVKEGIEIDNKLYKMIWLL